MVPNVRQSTVAARDSTRSRWFEYNHSSDLATKVPAHRCGEAVMAKAGKRPSNRRISWTTVRDLALALPGVEESTSYRTPAMKVRGKLIARLKEDAETIV